MASIHTNDLPAIGTPFEGGFFGGVIRSTAGLQAVAWAPREEGETSAVLLPTRNAQLVALSCHDSQANTRALAELGSPAAQWALGLQIHGFTDWLVAARDVLELAYRHLKPTDDKTGGYFRDGDNPSSVPAGYPYLHQPPKQTAVEIFRASAAQAFSKPWYHTSTQSSARDAWCQSFNYGVQLNDALEAEGGVRAVRLIPLIA
ncbi:hypothetical protein GCM10010975_26830 [Comamonas phosphati]|nr:hypothetical protein GCM10010975_26830 [Comamonas phosphati]